MALTKPTARHQALEKMRYIDTTRLADWTKRFSGKTPETAQPRQKPKRKIPPKKMAKKRIAPLTQPGTETKSETTPLVLAKKTPATFHIRRQDNPELFERMAFVIKACSKDPRRKFLLVLHVEQIRNGSWLVASDGKRLHAAFAAVKIRSGDYKPALTKDAVVLREPTTGIAFPDWRRVIPNDVAQRGVIDLADSGWGKNCGQTEKLSAAFNAFVRQTGEVINLRYLEDLAKRKWSIHCQREKSQAIMLKAEGAQEDMFAVIMPLPQTSVASQAA
jgi:hypothetical protein